MKTLRGAVRHFDAVVVGACSGHGFKFASVLGEVVADMLAESRTRYDLSFLSINRFLAR